MHTQALKQCHIATHMHEDKLSLYFKPKLSIIFVTLKKYVS